MYTLFGRAFKANPYPVYAALRAEGSVQRRVNADGKNATCFVMGYAESIAILRDHTRFVKDYRQTITPSEQAFLQPDPPLISLLSRHMLNTDPPDHTRLRALISKAFTIRIVEQLEDRIRTIGEQLLDQVLRKQSLQDANRNVQMDLIEEFAFPLPIIVIADLLGIPTRDHNRFRAWSHAIVQPSPNSARNQQKESKSRQLMEGFIHYLRGVLAERRRLPRNDLISSLLQAEEAGDALSEDEIFSTLLLLIVVGHETSVNLIGNGLLTLFTHPETLHQLRQYPNLIPGAIEELVRYDGPVERAPMRFAAEDVEIGGTIIRRGDAVSVVLAAANRDPAQFVEPDQLKILRENNKHIGFGLGAHYCLGAPLARVEGRVAIELLLRRCPNLQMTSTVESLRWRTNPIMRGLHRLPVQFSR